MTLPIITYDKPTKAQMKLTWSLSIWKKKCMKSNKETKKMHKWKHVLKQSKFNDNIKKPKNNN
jgi:hypothetical protein